MEKLSNEDLTTWEKALVIAVNGKHCLKKGKFDPDHEYIARIGIHFYMALQASPPERLTELAFAAEYLAAQFMEELADVQPSANDESRPLAVRLALLRKVRATSKGRPILQSSDMQGVCAQGIIDHWKANHNLFRELVG